MNYRAPILAMLLALSTQVHAALVGHWTFDEGIGVTAHDSSGSNFDGAFVGSAAWSAGGRFGSALDLTGGGFVNMGNVLDLTGSFTVSGWAQTRASGGMAVVANHRGEIIKGYILAINDIGDGVGGAGGRAHFYKAYPTSPLSTTKVADGEWHLLTGVYDQTSATMSIYIDGVLEGTAVGATTPSYATSDFLVGGITNNTDVNQGFYTGLIDDVRVYDHALSGSEVAALVPLPPSVTLLGCALGVFGFLRRLL